MEANTKRESAFPLVTNDGSGLLNTGMALRDYFAATVIGPLMASNGVEMQLLKGGLSLHDLPVFCAEIAYETADAMLKEREK